MAVRPIRIDYYGYLFSGAALVFEDEVMELCRHDLYYVEKQAALRFRWNT